MGMIKKVGTAHDRKQNGGETVKKRGRAGLPGVSLPYGGMLSILENPSVNKKT